MSRLPAVKTIASLNLCSLSMVCVLFASNLWAQTPPEVIVGPLSRTSASPGDSGPITFDVSFSGASSAQVSVADVLVSATGSAAATVTTDTTFGSAMSFGPPASRPTDPVLDIDVASGITLEAWVKPSELTSSSGPGSIVNYDEFPAFGYGLHLEPGGDPSVMNLACRLGFVSLGTSNSPVRVGQWQHVACTFDGLTLRLYVDSVEQQMYEGLPPVNYGGYQPRLTVGVDINHTPLGAPLDELRIWSLARSQPDLAAGMVAPLSGTSTGLAGYWQFDALEDLATGPTAGSNDIRDLSGNDLHLDTEVGVALTASNALYGATVSLSDFAGNGLLNLSLAAGIAVDAVGTPSALKDITETISVAMDATAPQILSITPNVTSPTNADDVTFRVLFNEDVTDFAADDLLIARPGLTFVSTAITPIDGSNYDVLVSGLDGNGTLTIGVRAGAVQNSALLANTAEVSGDPLVIDNTGPNPTLSSLATSPLDGSPILVDIDFDEVVDAFVVTDLAVTNATPSAFTGSADSYSVTLTPTAYGEVSIKMAGFGAVNDLAGNPSGQGNTLDWSWPVPDTDAPFITSTSSPVIVTSAAFDLDITFSEPVVGFELADLVFSATGTAAYAEATLTEQTPSTWRINITGVAGQGQLSIQIPAGSLTDASGNANELLTISQPIDRVGPGVTSSSVSPLSGASIGESITFQINADETVKTYNTNLITVIKTGDAGFLWPTAGVVAVNSSVVTITINGANVGGDGTLALQFNPGALTDNAGNPSTTTHTTPAVTVDHTLPELLSLQPVISERQFSPGVVVFEGILSEPAVIGGGFTVDYAFLDVSNPDYPADLNSLVRVGLPSFITPERFHIEVDLASVPYGADFRLWLVAQIVLQDTAGNNHAGERRSDTPAIIDLLATGVSISTPRALTNASPIPVNVQFTSATIPGAPTAVTGFALDDLNLTNATASNLAGSGADYSFDLTPIAEGEVSVWVSAYAARDANDRPNRNSEYSYVEYDITGPAILSVEAKTTGNPSNDPFFPVFFEVSEPLNRASLESAVGANLVTTGSLISGIQHSDAVVPGYEVVEILNSPSGEGTVTFAVPAGAVTDLAGNPSTNAFALPAPVSVDFAGPTASVSYTFVAGANPIDVTSDSISATAVTFVFTFSEPVKDVQAGDFTVDRDGPLGYAGTSLLVNSPTQASFTVSGIESDGVLTATLRAGGVTDLAGNGNVAAALSVNINNIATEVVSITPDSLAISADSTSFLVEWSKPVSGFALSRFKLTDSSFVNSESITITEVDSLRTRVEVLGLTGTGEFALEILDGAARDRFNNPNFSSFTSPLVTRTGVQMFGQFSVLTGGEANDYQAVGNPDLIINEVFALRGDGVTPARLTWDGQFLTLFGRFEILTSPGMVLFDGTGIIDSYTGQITLPSLVGYLPMGGTSPSFRPCSARLILNNRALRLSGGILAIDGFFNNAVIDPRNPANHLALDSQSTFSVGSPSLDCVPSDLEFQVLNFAETTRGFAFDVRTLNVDETSELGLITGRIDYEDGFEPKLSGFNLRFSGFDWQAEPDASIPRQGTAQLLPGELRFAVLTRYQSGLIFETFEMKIASNLDIQHPDILDVNLPCILSVDCPRGSSRTIVTMHDPVFGAGLITSTNSIFYNSVIAPDAIAVFTTASDVTSAEISPSSSYVRLPKPHYLTIAQGTSMLVPEARIDAEAYWAPSTRIGTDIGVFGYRDVAISHYLEPTVATLATTPAIDGEKFGGLRILGMTMPLRKSRLVWDMTLALPEFLTDIRTVHQTGDLEGNTFPGIKEVGTKWCTLDGIIGGIAWLDIKSQPFCLTYSNPPPSYLGKINLGFPVGFQLTGSLGIADGEFDALSVGWLAGAPPLPLGSSGVFLTGLELGLWNISQKRETCVTGWVIDGVKSRELGVLSFKWDQTCTPDPMEFRGTANFAFGPTFKLPADLPPPLGDSVQYYMGVQARTWISDERIKAEGDFFVFSPNFFKMSQMSGVLTYAGPRFEGSMKQANPMVPGLYGTAKIGVGNLYVNGELIASVEVPDTVPVIGGYVFASVGLGVSSVKPSITGSFYAFGASFAVGVDFKGNVYYPSQASTLQQVSTKKKASELKSWESSTVYQVGENGQLKKSAARDKPSFTILGNYPTRTKRYLSATTQALASTITIDSSAPTLVRLAWANQDAVPDFTLVGPDGTVFSPATVETDPSVFAPVGFLLNVTARDATYVFNQPVPGVYTVTVGNTGELGETALEVRAQNAEPSFEFVNTVTTGDELFLDWKAADADDDAQIRIYLDNDRAGLNGIEVAGPFSEDSQSTTTVDLAAVNTAPGTYWIYAQVDDGVNAPKTVYAGEPLFFVNPDAPPAILDIDVVAEETMAIVRWEPSPDPDIIGYAVRWTTDIEGSLFEESMSVEKELSSAVVTGLTPNTTYKFTVVARKRGSGIAARRLALQDIYNAAEGNAVSETSNIEYLGDQIARLAASTRHSKSKASKNLVTYRINRLGPVAVPLVDQNPEPAMAESLVAEFDIVKTTALVGQNNAPEFLSQPVDTVSSSSVLQYAVELLDSDGDVVSLTLVEGPQGMTLNAENLLSWTPDGVQGVFAVTLEANDGVATTRQNWYLTSTGVFVDAFRISDPAMGAAPPGELFMFKVETQGGCDSPVSYRLLTAPEGMTINGVGLIEWPVPATETTDAQVVVAASQVCARGIEQTSRTYFVDVEAAGRDVAQIIEVQQSCADGPTATLSGPLPVNGPDQTAALQVDLTGTAPWVILWSDGEYQANIQASPVFRTVPRDGQTYSLAGVSDARCSGAAEGLVVVLLDAIEIPVLRNGSLALLALLLAAWAVPALRRSRP